MAFSAQENIYHWSICLGRKKILKLFGSLFIMFTQIIFTQWRKCNRKVCLIGSFNFYSLEVMVKVMSLKKISRTHTQRGAWDQNQSSSRSSYSYFYSCILKTVRGYFCMKNKLPCSNKLLNEMCLKLYFGWYYTAAPGWIIYQSLCLSKTSLNLNYNGISNEFFLTQREKKWA